MIAAFACIVVAVLIADKGQRDNAVRNRGQR